VISLNPWWKFSTDVALASFETQRVIGLRMLKLAAGGPAAKVEAQRMVAEKTAAWTEAAVILAAGGSAHNVLQHCRTIIRANERRLTRRKR
jgi:geranylgeranyl pyrophosphate synthase